MIIDGVKRLAMSPAPPSGIITAGLVVHYPCNESTGTLLNDSTPNGHNANLAGMDESNWVPGYEGSAIHIDAGNLGQHAFNNTLKVDGYSEISLCIRAKASHSFSQIRHFMHHHGPDTQTGCTLQHSSVLGFAIRTKVTGYNLLTAADAWRDGLWHSIIGTYDGADQIFYLDGNEIGRSTASSGVIDARPSDFSFTTGATNFAGGLNLWDTTIDDIRTYDRALSPVECAQIAAGTG